MATISFWAFLECRETCTFHSTFGVFFFEFLYTTDPLHLHELCFRMPCDATEHLYSPNDFASSVSSDSQHESPYFIQRLRVNISLVFTESNYNSPCAHNSPCAACYWMLMTCCCGGTGCRLCKPSAPPGTNTGVASCTPCCWLNLWSNVTTDIKIM